MALEDATKNLGPLALAIVTLAVVVGVGSIVLAEMEPVSYVENSVTGEPAQPAGPFPANFTVDKQSNADFEKIESGSTNVTFEDVSAGTNTTLTEGTDYVVFEDAGKIEVQNTSATTDYNGSEDHIFSDYTWLSSETATSILNTGITSLQTFADFFTVIIVIGIAAVLFVMLRFVRGAQRVSA